MAVLFLSGWLGSVSFAQTSQLLIGWDLPGSVSTVNYAPVSSSTNATGLVAGQSMIMGPQLTPHSHAQGWGAANWTNGGSDAFLNNSLDKYFGFTVVAEAGKKVTITGVSKLSLQLSSAGPRKFNLLVSKTNTTSAFAVPFKNYGPFDVTNPTASGTASHSDITVAISNSINADPVVVDPGQTLYFRLIGWAGTGSTGSGRISATNVFTTGSPLLDFGLTGTVETLSVSKNLTWNGGSSGTWDSSVTSWYATTPASPVAFADGDTVSFPVSTTTTIAVPVAVSPASLVASISPGQTLQFTGNGPIASPSSLVIDGGGSFQLGVPTSLGAIQLNAGQLVATANNALSGNLVTAANSSVNIGSTTHSSLGSASFAQPLVGTGSLTASLGYTFTVDQDATLSASLAGAGGLKKDGTGKLTVAGSHSYLGNVNLNAGILETSASEQLPDTAVVVFGAGTVLRLGGNEILASLSASSSSATARVDLQGYNLTLTATSSNQFQGAITGAGSLVRQGSSILSLGENNTFSGGTVLKEGLLRLQGSGIRTTNLETGEVTLVSSPFGTGVLTLRGGKIYSSGTTSRTLYSRIDIQGDFTMGDTGASSSGDMNVSTNVSGAATVLSSNAIITVLSPTDWYQNITGPGKNLGKAGSGMLRLRGFSTLDTLFVSAGPLHSQSSNNISSVVVGDSGVLGWGYSNIVGPCAYLGSATLALSNGATLGQYGACGLSNEIVDRTLTNPIRILGDVTLGLGTYSSYFSGGVDLTGQRRAITLSNSAVLSGAVTNGTLRLVSSSSSRTLTLSASNQLSGVLDLAGGTLVLSNSHALQGITQILFNGNATNGGTLGLSPVNNADYSALFSSGDLQNYRIDTGGADSTLATALGSTNGTFFKTGLGTLTLPVANLFAGGATLSVGRLALGHNQALGTGEFLVDQSGVEIEALVPLTLGQDVRLSGSPTLLGNQPITIGGTTRVSGGNRAFYPSNTGGLTLNRVELSTSPTNNAYRLVIYGTSPVVVNGPIVDGTNAIYPNGIPGGHFRMSNPSTVTFRGTNTYTGPTWIEAGTLRIETTRSLPANGNLQLNGGILRLIPPGTYQVGNLSGSIETNTVVLTNVVETNEVYTFPDGSVTNIPYTITNVVTNSTVQTNPIQGTVDMGTQGAVLRVASMTNWITNSVLTFTNYLVSGSVAYLPTNLTSEQIASIKNAANPAATASVDSQGLLSFSGSGNTAPSITVGQVFAVPENSTSGALVGAVVASDSEGNFLSGWTIVSGDLNGAFFINSSGEIRVAGIVNFEVNPSYTLGVQVSDGTELSAIQFLTINVENIPEFTDVFGASAFGSDDNGDGVSNLMAYAMGAISPSSSIVKPAVTTTSSSLSITALVRTNDPKCQVVGEATTSLTAWPVNSPILGVAAADQSGAVAGVTQKQVFSVDRGTDPKKFLRLKTILQP